MQPHLQLKLPPQLMLLQQINHSAAYWGMVAGFAVTLMLLTLLVTYTTTWSYQQGRRQWLCDRRFILWLVWGGLAYLAHLQFG